MITHIIVLLKYCKCSVHILTDSVKLSDYNYKHNAIIIYVTEQLWLESLNYVIILHGNYGIFYQK